MPPPRFRIGLDIRPPFLWAARKFAFGDRFDKEQNGHSVRTLEPFSPLPL